MENKPVKSSQSTAGLQISDRSKLLVPVVVHVNLLIPFRMERDEVTMWANSIAEIAPDVTPNKLRFVLDLFKADELEWDRTKGIQNIFSGLKFIAEEDGKYVFKKPKY